MDLFVTGTELDWEFNAPQWFDFEKEDNDNADAWFDEQERKMLKFASDLALAASTHLHKEAKKPLQTQSDNSMNEVRKRRPTRIPVSQTHKSCRIASSKSRLTDPETKPKRTEKPRTEVPRLSRIPSLSAGAKAALQQKQEDPPTTKQPSIISQLRARTEAFKAQHEKGATRIPLKENVNKC